MTYLLYILIFPVLWLITFILFLAIMAARRARDEQTLQPSNRLVWYTCLLILAVGLVSDFLLNLVLTFRFLERPKELLSTQRLKRLKKTGTGWRKELAIRYCEKWLTPFDPQHCDD